MTTTAKLHCVCKQDQAMLWSESRKGSNWVEIKIIRIKKKKEKKKPWCILFFFYVKNTFYSKEADVNQSLKKESSLVDT